jgi:predicted MFS family arabinose efflux permease
LSLLVTVVMVSVTVIMVALLAMNMFTCPRLLLLLLLLLLHHAHSLLLHSLLLDVLDKLGNSHAGLFSILGNSSLNLSNLLGRGTLARHGHGNATLRRAAGRRRS